MLMDPLWDQPPGDAPALAKNAWQLMQTTLKKIESRVQGVLDNPGQVSGELVLDEAIAALANPKVDADLRLATLSELQDRMRSIDPSTPRRLFLVRPADQSAVANTLADDLESLAQFDASLEDFIVQQRPGAALHRHLASGLSPAEFAGLLLALLVTRLGQGSTLILGRVFESLASGAKPLVAGHWAWLDVELNSRGTVELRRVFLDPTTLAAWVLAARGAKTFSHPPAAYKAGRRNLFWRRVADKCFRALIRKVAASGPVLSIKSLKALCNCEVQRLRMVTMPVVATYAEAGFSSSSLEPATWCRLIGFEPPPQAGEPQRGGGAFDPTDQQGAGPPPLPGSVPSAEHDTLEQMTAGDLDQNGVVAALRNLMTAPRVQWAARFSMLIAQLASRGPEHQTEELVVRWLDYLANERRSRGKRLSDGSIRNYRGLLANRLLEILPNRLEELTQAELEAAYTEVIMSRRSREQTGHILAALGSFDRYIRDHHLPTLPSVSLSGVGSGSYAISSRILVEDEFQAGLKLTEGQDALRAFWILAYRFGLRRTEILGLQERDVGTQVLRIRVNEARHLKTSNAHRVLPLASLPGDERAAIRGLTAMKFSQDYLYFEQPPSAQELERHPVVAQVKHLLQEVTGDSRLHAHNMRHSAATLHMLGVLGSDLRLASHPYEEPWMHEAIIQSKAIDREISGSLYRRGGRGNALAMMMGHGSELTTYEHYTHCFDLLLFVACWKGHFSRFTYPQGVRRNERQKWVDDASRLFHPRSEAAQLLAMLGLAPTTQVETKDLRRLVRRICAVDPAAVTLLEPRVALAAGPAAELTLSDLLRREGATKERGYPAKAADRQSATVVFRHFSCALVLDRARLTELLWQWGNARLSGSDWASMTPADARKWTGAMQMLVPGLVLQVFHVYKDTSRRNVKSPVAALDDPKALSAKHGRYCIRIADSRGKISHRKSRRGHQRSHSQRSITWLLLTLLDYLGQTSSNEATSADDDQT
jgi:site-specific recombinase XerD